jgi:hypothetical protein
MQKTDSGPAIFHFETSNKFSSHKWKCTTIFLAECKVSSYYSIVNSLKLNSDDYEAMGNNVY